MCCLSKLSMETSEKISGKAYELFCRYGIRSVTMDEIAGQCGMSKKTLYQHFEDKNALVANIMADQISQSEDTCTLHQQQADNAVHEIFLAMDMVRAIFEGLNPALIYDLRKYHAMAFQQLEKHKQQFLFPFFKRNIERGIAEGLYRPDLNGEVLARLQLRNIMLIMEEDLFAGSHLNIWEIKQEISLFHLYGYATPKGVKQIEKYKQQRLKHTTV